MTNSQLHLVVSYVERPCKIYPRKKLPWTLEGNRLCSAIPSGPTSPQLVCPPTPACIADLACLQAYQRVRHGHAMILFRRQQSLSMTGVASHAKGEGLDVKSLASRKKIVQREIVRSVV